MNSIKKSKATQDLMNTAAAKTVQEAIAKAKKIISSSKTTKPHSNGEKITKSTAGPQPKYRYQLIVTWESPEEREGSYRLERSSNEVTVDSNDEENSSSQEEEEDESEQFQYKFGRRK